MTGSLVALICVNMASPGSSEREACSRTLEAVSLKYKVEEKVERVTKPIEKKLKEKAGERFSFLAVALYTVVVKNEVRFVTGDIPWVDSTIVTLTTDKAMLSLNWNFR